ncbi:short-chain fatty acyl-CoA regulator family protein [Sphingomonas donggukensis]|uniref:Short-chain fatty acyl-CoA regulator family protein n=1 Tax=Sphingomonas donggukensis TaxID=2949093 RepID=A0ABY4TUS3_9SPHN|nr:XRE family transcriptional regulator [Sphingomonas donggukensis]URW76083.1 short-chain fatty acyl-CoA regulator family protein [Sphingomonas donggukensis]
MRDRRRLFAGHEVRTLRARIAASQAELAATLGISVPYLSQIESNDRPLTAPVLLALARAYPDDWAGVTGIDEPLLLAAAGAASDPSIAAPLPEDTLRRSVEQQPQLARRMVAIHDAWRRAQEQLRILDDRMDAGTGDAARLPWEEVRDWFHAAGNYIDPLDRQAEALATSVGGDLSTRLAEAHGVRIDSIDTGGGELRRFDPARGVLTIDRGLPPESAAFLIAHQLVRLEMREAIAEIVAGAGLRYDASRQLLAVGLANYAAGAVVMPYAAFRTAAHDLRHDIDRLRQRFGVSFEQACHRLSTLQRPGAAGIPLFFLRVDMAGNITKRHSATRLQFARFGGACPLWVVHEAVAIPDRILVQRAEMPDGTRYVSMAKGLVKPSGSFARSPRRYAVALGCEEGDAADFIYADAVTGQPPTPIGISCRICPRPDCDQRAFPPAGTELRIDPDARAIVPYRFA